VIQCQRKDIEFEEETNQKPRKVENGSTCKIGDVGPKENMQGRRRRKIKVKRLNQQQS